jgi:hypothetical protein
MKSKLMRKKNNVAPNRKIKKKSRAPLPIGYTEWPKTLHQLQQCWLNQDVALRKKHLDEKILIEAERLKMKNQEKLLKTKTNHRIRKQETDKVIKKRFDEQLKKYHRRVTNAAIIKEKKKNDVVERNEAIDAHKQFKIGICRKKKLTKELKHYHKIKLKYKKVWHEDLPKPNPPQEPISLFKMVDRSPKTKNVVIIGNSASKTNIQIQKQQSSNRRPSTTIPSSKYTPASIGHKSRDTEEVKNRARELREKLAHERRKINLERLKKQKKLFKQQSIKLEKEEKKRKEQFDLQQQKKALHLTNIAAREAEKMQIKLYEQSIKLKKAKKLRDLFLANEQQKIEKKKEKAIMQELKGHYLKDKYDEELEEICKAQADLIRHRTELAKSRKNAMEQKDEETNSERFMESIKYREQQVEELMRRKATHLSEIRRKNEVAIRLHEERFKEIQRQIQIQKAEKAEKLKKKLEENDERIEKLYHVRKIRTQNHMNNTGYKRQYVLDDFAVPLNYPLVDTNLSEREEGINKEANKELQAVTPINNKRNQTTSRNDKSVLFLTPAIVYDNGDSDEYKQT